MIQIDQYKVVLLDIVKTRSTITNTTITQPGHPWLTATTEIEQLRHVLASPDASAIARSCAEQALEHILLEGQHENTTSGQALSMLKRKVSASGHISYRNHSHFVSRRLAGQMVAVRIEARRLIIIGTRTIHKEFSL